MSEWVILFTYFLSLIFIGTVLLSIPSAWNGDGRLGFIDSLFTSVSAVCVTGLITVDTAQFTLFGKIVLLLLIQFGGLGILTFTTIIFISATKTKKVSLRSLQMVRNFYLDSIEFKAHHIIRDILKLTFGIEFIGAFLLWLRFRHTVGSGAVFYAVFHAISAFCNAGFSLFSDSLKGYNSDPFLLTVIMLLIVLGGLGFLIYNDIANVVTHRKKRLALHTIIVLKTTAILVVVSTLFFFLLEYHGIEKNMSLTDKFMNALFCAITPRTAGFNTVDVSQLTATSKFITIFLMFIGGSPASIAGGIKTTTFAIVFLAIVKDVDWKGRLRLSDRIISSAIVSKAMLFLGKAVSLLGLSIFLLTLTEMRYNPSIDFFSIVFESVSAFGTVGLSTGLTSQLSIAGKIVIILTMFAGRVGLMSLTIPLFKEYKDAIDYPEEEVLVG